MNELSTLANLYGTDKGTIYPSGSPHGYTELYESYFDSIKHRENNILEIGVGTGNSLKMWKHYFPNSHLYAMDCISSSEEKVKIFKGDQGNRNCIEQMMNHFKVNFDIIIDDGSHKEQDQQISLGCLFPFVKSGGLYIIEDLTIPGISNKMGFRNDVIYKSLYSKNLELLHHLNENEIRYLMNNIDYVSITPDIPKEFAVAIIKKK